MKISIEYLARLARLSLSDTERETYGSQIDSILEYMEQMNELDTGDVAPTSHVLSLTNVMREDTRADSLPSGEALRNAPDHTDRFFRVPKIIE